MHWLVLTFLSLISRAVLSLTHKVMTTETRVLPEVQSFFFVTVSMVLTVLLMVLFGLPLERTEILQYWFPLFGIALTQGLGVILYFRALKELTSGTAQILFSSILFFSMCISVLFSGTHFSVQNIVGALLLAVAIVLVSEYEQGSARAALLMLCSAFFFAIYQVISASIAQSIHLSTYLLATYSGAAACAFFASPRAVMNALVRVIEYASLVRIAIVSALLSLGNVGFAYLAYATAPEPIKVALLLTAQVVVTVVLAYFFLRERALVSRKIFAAMLIVVAAYFIKG